MKRRKVVLVVSIETTGQMQDMFDGAVNTVPL